MKLITLNTWGGRAMQPLMNFFQKHKNSTDIFCLQEMHNTTQGYRDLKHPDEWVRWDLWERVQKAMPDFYGDFAGFTDNPDRMSVAMLIRRGWNFGRPASFLVYWPVNPVERGSAVISPRKIQYVEVELNGKRVRIANYHGLWIPGGKLDTAPRLEQSAVIRRFMDWDDVPLILCGDFNLEPQTESIAVLEKGMRNLVKDFGVKSTRTVLYRDYDNPDESQFADYIFTSPGIKINKFSVMPDLCSDHTPLFLDFTF